MKLNQLLQALPKDTHILEGHFGIEREGLRVTQEGHVSQREHPQSLGSRNRHPYIQTDFSEAQLELITPVSKSTKEIRRRLGAITDVAQRSLEADEVIWPLSMPPYLQEAEIHIAKLDNPSEVAYRSHLADKYGVLLQSISGIHYNFEIGSQPLDKLFQESGYSSRVTFKNDLYMKLARQFLTYRWLLTYLYGASPLAEREFYSHSPKRAVRSLRSSKAYGYNNKEEVKVSFQSIERYIEDIEKAVASGHLSMEKEFYSPIRLRGAKHNHDYLEQGVTYMEFRSFDLNPFDSLGMSQETLDTFHLIILALLWMDEGETSDKTIEMSKAINEAVALAHPLDALPQEADPKPLLLAMQEVIEHFDLDEIYQTTLTNITRVIQNPEETMAAKLLKAIENNSLMTFGTKMANNYHQLAWQAPYALKGYESMELSTQMVMFDAIQKGLHLEILDERDQFIKLWHQDHIEYVKNGNMTAKDNYVIPLAMANKTVTKKILDQAGFPTPQGQEFANKAEALAYFPLIANKAIVVKPKSTNFGLGISIFPEKASKEDYQKAVEIAFAEDHSILVEDFITGTEYRFFVLDGECLAVLLRLAANVVGDGSHTIQELIDLKNENPLRGYDHRSPLEKIQLGQIERLYLAQEGYTPETILAPGEKAVLRGNSNISTGGDSVDVTDQMDDSYKQLAAEMAKAMGAWVCGVDLIIPDMTQVSSPKNPNCTCIELNFNPSMYMHTYCQEGPGQAITPKIIEKLFPELT